MPKVKSCLCEQSHKGNFSPKFHDSKSNWLSWKGGVQLLLTSKVSQFWDATSVFNLIELAKWISKTTPSNIFKPIFRDSNFESCPKLWVKVPLIWLLSRSKDIKDERFPIDDGIGPEIDLYPKERLARFLNCPSSIVNYPDSWALDKSKISSPFEAHPNRLSNISDISWLHLLYDKLIPLKLQRLPKDLGTFPSSSLYDKSLKMADVRFPMELEIVPCKWL